LLDLAEALGERLPPCVDVPDAWFAVEDRDAAIRACHSCHAEAECLRYAVAVGLADCVAGGIVLGPRKRRPDAGGEA
jgi:hypothetical protein